MKKYDCVIVGASLLGVWLALELKERGLHVMVLDRKKSMEPTQQLTTVLDLSPLISSTKQDEDDLMSMCSTNFEHTVDRFASGAVRIVRDLDKRKVMVVDEEGLWASLVDAAITRRVEFRWNHSVTGVRVGASGVAAIRTFHGPIPVERVVVAAGAATIGIISALGIQLPIIPERAYWATYPTRGGEPRLLRIPMPDPHPKRVSIPSTRSVHDSVVLTVGPEGSLVGRFSTFGLGGPRTDALAAQHLAGVAAAAWTIRQDDTFRIGVRIHAHVTADWLPINGHIPGVDGLYIGVPHGPRGNALVPAMAVALAELIVKRNLPVWATSWSPSRFAQSAPGGRKAVMD